MQTQSIKEQAHQLVDNLPDSATWEDVMYRIYIRQAIETAKIDPSLKKGSFVFPDIRVCVMEGKLYFF